MEKDLENRARLKIKAMGGLLQKFTSPGRKGPADRIATMPGNRIYFCEFKNGKAGTLSVHQIKWQADMAKLGIKVWNISNEQQLQQFLNFILAN